MSRRHISRVAFLWFCTVCLGWMPVPGFARLAGDLVATAQIAGKTTTFHPLSPGPVDGHIALVSAKMLEKYHYLRQPFNEAVSTNFFERYLETLDPQHLHFLQSDLAEFDHYRTNLHQLTVPARGLADTRPACEIFNRFVQRLQQRVDYADQLLKDEKFTFDTDERIAVSRKEMPYPSTIEDAHRLWRERLRFEYLQEKLGKLEAQKKTAAAKSEPSKSATTATAKPAKTPAEEIVDTLSRRYHRNLHTFTDLDSDDVLQIYLTTLARVYDPHSDYFGHSQLDSFAIAMNLSLFGIGAELVAEDGYCTIHRLLPGGPAAKSKKIQEKDRIVAVAQSNQPPVDVVDMSLNKAVQLIRGPKGTEVRLTIIPAGAGSAEQREISLIRDEIKLEDQEAKAKVIEVPGDHGQMVRLGVIDLPSFYASFDPTNTRGKSEPRSTTADVAQLLTKLKREGVGGVILDLRRNGGGSLEEAIKLTGLFIKEGPVVQVRDFDGGVQVDEDTDPAVLYNGPLIVLTSRFSASASEIVAGALQDYGRALVVGDSSTHGKGTVQSVQPLKQYLRVSSALLTNDPGALKLTIKKFYRASGASTQLKGVTPDIVLPSVLNEMKEVGEGAQENPMPWDTIQSANYEHLNFVQPYVAFLRQRSNQRTAVDKEYGYVHEDIETYRKQQADKTVSLNEKQRLKEKEELDLRAKAREKERKERLAKLESTEKVYELSLKQALLPGLPPPVVRTNSLAKVPAKGQGAEASTNETASAGVGAPRPGETGLEDPVVEDEKPPTVDASLTEAEHIMVDYLSVFQKDNVAKAGH